MTPFDAAMAPDAAMTPFYVAGRPDTSVDALPVRHPCDGRPSGVRAGRRARPRLAPPRRAGEGPVGAPIRAAVPHKHVTLELGGNAAVVVCGDWSVRSDVDRAADAKVCAEEVFGPVPVRRGRPG